MDVAIHTFGKGKVPGWVLTQKKTFTGWCNQYLIDRQMRINDLVKDLQDGVLLINLLEEISNKKILRYTPKPRFRAQQIENCSKALTFIKREGIKLVAIGPEDIGDGNLKLILGMIWTLILRYEINRGGNVKGDLLDWIRLRIRPYGKKVSNFKEDWRDGSIIAALTDSFRPGSLKTDGDPTQIATAAMTFAEKELKIPMILDPNDMVNEPDDLSILTYLFFFKKFEESSDTGDEIIQFVGDYKFSLVGSGLKEGKCGHEKTFTIVVTDKKTNEPHATLTAENFTIKVTGPEEVSVSVNEGKAGEVKCYYKVLKNPGDYTVSISFDKKPVDNIVVPWLAGDAPVESAPAPTENETQVSSPVTERKTEETLTFPIKLDLGSGPEPVNVKVSGFGITGGDFSGESVQFSLSLVSENGKLVSVPASAISVKISGPENLSGVLTTIAPGDFTVTYHPTKPQAYFVDILLAGNSLCGQPIRVPFTGKLAEKKEEALSIPIQLNLGKGPQKVDVKFGGFGVKGGAPANGPVTFWLNFVDEQKEILKIPIGSVGVKISGAESLTGKISQSKPGDFIVEYLPQKENEAYLIDILLAGTSILNGKLIKVFFGLEAKAGDCEVKGLKDFRIDFDETFQIVANTPEGKPKQTGGDKFEVKLTIVRDSIETSIPAKVVDENSGLYTVHFKPTVFGKLIIVITLDGNSVKGNPFIAYVLPKVNTKCALSGPGLVGGPARRPYSFFIDVTDDNKNVVPLPHEVFNIEIKDPSNANAHTELISIKPGSFEVKYAPELVGKYLIILSLFGKPVANEIPVNFSDVESSEVDLSVPLITIPLSLNLGKGAQKVNLLAGGPGLEGGSLPGSAKQFFIRLEDENKKLIAIPINLVTSKVTGAETLDVKITGSEPGSFIAEYTPTKTDVYYVDIFLSNASLLQNKPYRVSFQEAGSVDLNIDLNDPFLLETPLTLNVGKGPQKVKVIAGGLGVKGGNLPGRAVKFYVRLVDGPSGNLIPLGLATIGVKITGAETITPEIDMKKPGDFIVSYHPTKEDVYNIQVLLGSSPIGKPYEVTWGYKNQPTEEQEEFSIFFPFNLDLGKGPQKVSVALGGFGIKGGKPHGGKPVHFFVQFRNEDESIVPLPVSALACKISGPENLEGAISQRSKPGDFLVKYSPTHDDATYLVALVLGGREIFKPVAVFFGIVPLADATKCDLAGLRGFRVNDLAAFKIIAKDANDKQKKAGGDHFDVQLIGHEDIDYPAKIIDGQNGEYTVQFKPTVVGKVRIEVTLEGKPISKSPYTAYVLPATSTRAVLSGKGLNGGPIKKPLSFGIRVIDQNKKLVPVPQDVIHVSIAGPDDVELPLTITTDEPGVFTIKYTAQKAGLYKAKASLFGSAITNPITFKCQEEEEVIQIPGLGKGSIQLGGAGITGGYFTSKPVSFFVHVKDDKDEFVEVKLADVVITATASDSKSLTVTTDLKDKGHVVAQYTPPKVGEYNVAISISGKPLKDGGFKVTFIPVPKFNLSFAGDGLKGGNISKPLTFKVLLKDDDGKPVKVPINTLNLNIAHEKTKAEVPAVVELVEDGVFLVTYQPPSPGTYDIFLFLFGGTINKQPIKAKCTDFEVPSVLFYPLNLRTSAKNPVLSLYGHGITGGVKLPKPVFFVIKFADEAGNGIDIPVTVAISDPKGSNVSTNITKGKTLGTSLVTYPVSYIGTYSVKLSSKGVALTDPIKVQFADAPKLNFLLDGPGLQGGDISRPLTFTLKTLADSTPVALPVEAISLLVSPLSGQANVPSAVTAKAPGEFEIAYQPQAAGDYLINLGVLGAPVSAEPIKVSCLGSPSDVISIPLVTPEQQLLNMDIPMPIELAPPEISLEAIAPTLASADPNQTTVANLDPSPAVGEPTSFTIVAATADGTPKTSGGDVFTVAVTTPRSSALPVKVDDNGDGTYSVSYSPESEGPLSVAISLGSSPIRGSPFNVSAVVGGVEPESQMVFDLPLETAKYKLKIGGPGSKSGTIGKIGTVYLKVADKATGKPADVTEKNISFKTEPPVKDIRVLSAASKATFAIRYSPVKPDDYNISIGVDSDVSKSRLVPWRSGDALLSLNLSPILTTVKNLPKTVAVNEPTTFSIVGKDPTGKVIPIKSEIPVDVRVTSKDGEELPIKINFAPDGTVEAAFTPEKEADLIIDVALGGEPIKDSPIAVQATSDGLPIAIDIPLDLEMTTNRYKIKAGGRGLKSGQLGKPGDVFIKVFDKKTKTPVDLPADKVLVEAKGPSKINQKVLGSKKNVGTYVIRYEPERPGKYDISLSVDGDKTKPRIVPWHAVPGPNGADPILTEVRDLSPFVAAKQPASFTVLTKLPDGTLKKGGDPIDVQVTYDDATDSPVKVRDNKNGEYTIEYIPTKPGAFNVDVSIAGVPVDGSPFRVEATPDGIIPTPALDLPLELETENYKVHAGGPGFKFGRVGRPGHIYAIVVDKATKKRVSLPTHKISLHATGPVPVAPAKVSTWRTQPGLYAISYSPEEAGVYGVSLLLDNDPTKSRDIKWSNKPSANSASPKHSKVKDLKSVLPVKAPAKFQIVAGLPDGSEKPSGGDVFDIRVASPDGTEAPVKVTDNGNGTYDVEFTPSNLGPLNIDVGIAGEPLSESPFSTEITPDGVDPDKNLAFELEAETSKYKLSIGGRGLKSGEIGKPGKIFLKVKDKKTKELVNVPVENVGLNIEGPVPVTFDTLVSKKHPGTYAFSYSPSAPGVYNVAVSVDKESTKSHPVDWASITPSSPYIQNIPTEVFSDEPVYFQVYNVDKEPEVIFSEPVENVTITKQNEGYNVSFISPNKPTHLDVAVKENGKVVHPSPFTVGVVEKHNIPFDFTLETPKHKLAVGGSGLKAGQLGKPGVVYVKVLDKKTREPVPVPKESVNLNVTGPSAVAAPKVLESKNSPGTFVLHYCPEEPGKYDVAVAVEGASSKPHKVSWYPAATKGAADPKKTTVTGLPEVLPVDQPTSFNILTHKPVGGEPIDIKVTSADATDSPVKVTDLGNGDYSAEFKPTKVGPITVDVAVGGEPITGSPFHVDVTPDGIENLASMVFDIAQETPKYKLSLGGRGLKAGQVGKPGTVFLKVFDKHTKKPVPLPVSKVSLSANGPQPVGTAKVLASKSQPGTFVLRYAPDVPGDYDVSIVVDNDATKSRVVPWSIAPDLTQIDPSKTEVYGLAPTIPLDAPTVFSVITKTPDGSKKEFGGDPVNVKIIGSDGEDVPVSVKDLENGEYAVEFQPTKTGPIDVDVSVAGIPVPFSPFHIEVSPDGMELDSAMPFEFEEDTPKYKLSVGGRGLTSGRIGKPGVVYLKVKDKKTKQLVPLPAEQINLKVEGPGTVTPSKVLGSKSHPGTFVLRYEPEKEGNYKVAVLVDKDSSKSHSVPWHKSVPPVADPSLTEVKGLPETVAVNEPVSCIIDVKLPDGKDKTTGDDPIDVKLTDHTGTEHPVKVSDLGNGDYQVDFTPTQEGPLALDIALAGTPIGDSPYHLLATPEGIEPLSDLDLSLELETPKYKIRAGGKGLKFGRIGKPGVVYAQILDKATKKKVNVPLEKVGLNVTGATPVPAPKVRALKTVPGVYVFQYQPNEKGVYDVAVQVDGSATKSRQVKWHSKSPANASSPNTSEISGLESVLPIKIPATFKVLGKTPDGKPKEVGGEPFDIKIVDGEGLDVPVKVDDNGDGTYTAKFTPVNEGPLSVDVAVGGEPLVGSPFKSNVTPDGIDLISEIPLESSTETPNYKLRVGGDGLKSGRIGRPGTVALKVIDKKTKKPVNVPAEKVTLKSKGPAPLENLKVKASKKVPGTYAISYLPEQPGTYELFVVVDRDETKPYPVSWHLAPVSAIPADAKNVDIKGLYPVLTLDKPASFTIVANDAHGNHKPVGGDPFDVTVTNADGEKSPVKVSDLGNGEYKVEFTPEKEGPLTIDVALAGLPVDASPVKVDVTPDGFEPLEKVNASIPMETSKHKLKVGGPGLKFGQIGKPGTVFVKVFDKETDKPVTVSPESLAIVTKGPAPVEAAKVVHSTKSPNTYALRYSPETPGSYEVAISLDGEATKPKQVNWHPKPHGPNVVDPVASEVRGLESSSSAPLSIAVDQPSSFVIAPVNADGDAPVGNEPLDIKITQADGTEAPVKIEELPDGTYQVSFTPEKEGPLAIDVAFSGEPLESLPFDLEVAPDGVDLESAPLLDIPLDTPKYKILAGGRGLKSGRIGKVGDIVVKVIDKATKSPAKVPAEKVGLASKGPASIAPATVLASKSRPGTFLIRYAPDVEGEYYVGVTVNEDSTKLRPVKWHRKPATGLLDPSQVEVKGINPVAKVGEPIPITIVSRDPDGSVRPLGADPFDIKVTNPDGTETAPKLEDLGNGEYVATVTPNKPGPLTIDINSNGVPVGSSPFSTNVTPDGVEPQEVIEAALGATDEEVGKYKVKIGGPGLKFGQVGKPGKVFVKVLDKDSKKPVNLAPEKVGLKIDGPTSLAPSSVKASKKLPGVYSIQYDPVQPGDYDVAVIVDNHALKPKKVKWHERPKVTVVDPKQSKVQNLPDTIALGEPTTFTVALAGPDSLDAPNGVEPLDVVVTNPDGTQSPVKVEDNADGTYDVTFTPEQVGPLKIDLGASGVPLESSPINVTVTPDGVDPEAALAVDITPNNEHTTPHHKLKIGGDGLHSGRVGHPGKVFVKVFDKETKLPVAVEVNKVGLKIDGPSSVPTPKVKASKKKPGLYSLNYEPETPGTYEVAVAVDGHSTKPYKVNWSPEPAPGAADPRRSEIAGLPSVVPVDKPTTFNIVAAKPDGSPKGKGGDTFDVSITKEDGTQLPVTVDDLGDGTYQVQFTPDSLSPLDVNVDIAGLPVGDSPVHIAVTPDGIDEPVYSSEVVTPLYKLRVGGPGLRAGRVGKVGTIHLKVLDKTTSSPVDVNPSTIKLLSVDSPASLNPSVLSSSKQVGTYAIRYTPTTPGTYNLSIAVGDRNRTPPKAVTVVDTPPELASALSNPNIAKLIPVKNLPSSVVVDEPVQFTVSAPPGFEDANLDDPIQIKVTSPDGLETPVTVEDLGNGDYEVEFVPHAEGPLEVDVAFAGVPLSDKPFTVDVTGDVEPESLQQYDTEFETKQYKIRLGGRGLKSGQTNTHAPIFVKVLDKRSENLVPIPSEDVVLNVSGPGDIKPPKVRGSKDRPGTFVIKYSASVPGIYDVNVVVDKEHTKIKKVPWRAAPIDGRLPLLEIKELPSAIAKDQPTSFLVSPVEGSDVPLDVSALDIEISSPDHLETPVKVTPTKDGSALVEFTPTAEGPINLDVAVNGIPLETIPAVEVTPDGLESALVFDQEIDTQNYKIRIGGRGLKFGRIGKPATILVKIIDKKTKKPLNLPASDIQLLSKGPKPVPTPKTLASKKQPGTYGIIYSPTAAGVYDIGVSVKADKTRTRAVPWHSSKPNQPDAAKSLIDGLPSVIAVDQPTNFTVIPRSADGSDRPEGGDAVDVKVVGANDVEVPVKVTDLGNGEYAVSFTPTKEGILDIDVAVAGEPVLDNPLHVLVTPDGVEPDLKLHHPVTVTTPKHKLQITGPGLKSGSIGTPAPIYLKVTDTASDQPVSIPVSDIVLDVKGPAPVPAPKVLASKKQPGTYVVRYAAKEPGTYQVGLVVAGDHTKPKSVNWHRPNHSFPSPELSEIIGLESAVPLDEPVQFILNSVAPDGKPQRTGGAPVDVSVTGEDGADLPVKVEDLGTGEYLVEFTPNKEGPLDVDVAIAGVPVADFHPFHLDATSDGVELPSSISLDRDVETPHYKLSIGGPGLKSGRIGRPGSVFVKVMDKETGEPVTVPTDDVNLEATGPAPVPPAKVIPSHKLPGTYVLRYSPEIAGDYKVVLSVGAENETKPISVAWRPSPGPHAADPSKSVIDNLEPTLHVNKPVAFSVIPKTHDGKTKGTGLDPLDVKVTAHDGTEFPVKIVDDGSGEYVAEFTPTIEGPLDVDVAIAGIPIAGSPFPVTVTADGKDPEVEFDTPLETTNYKLKVGGKGLKTGQLGKPGRVFVKVFDKADKPVSLPVQEIKIEANGPAVVAPAKVIALPKAVGTYVLRYLPTHEGSYDVSILVSNDRTRPRAVRWVSGASSANADKFEISDLLERYKSGVPSTFKIVPNDPSITYGGEKFTISVKNDDQDAPITIKDLENGQYIVEFVPPDVGDMVIDVKLGDGHVVGSPFNAFVVPGPSLRCIVTGDGIFGGTVKVPLRFTVHAMVETSKKIRNPVPEDAIAVSIVGPNPNRSIGSLSLLSPRGPSKSVPISYVPPRPVFANVALRRPGIFDVTYTLEHPGEYDIVVSVFGDSVTAEPFLANAFQPRASAANTTVDIPKLFPINVPVQISINPKTESGEPVKSLKEPFDCQVTTKDGKKILSDVVETNGIYVVEFTPDQVGAVDVEVLLDGVPLAGSPYTSTIVPRCTLSGDDLKGGKLKSKPVEINVNFADDKKKPVKVPKFSVNVQGPNKEEVPVTISSLPSGDHLVKFKPTKGGDYTVQVGIDGTPLLDQPQVINYSSAPQLLPIKLAKDPRTDVGAPCVISVPLLESSGAPIDPSLVSVDVDGPEKLKGTVKLDPDSAQPSHIISFNPTKPGTYNVGINHGGQPLVSPIPVTVLPAIEPTRSEVVGIPETKKGLDEPLTFKIVAKDRTGKQLPVGGLGHEKDFDIRIDGDTPLDQAPPKIVDNDDGTYTVSWLPEKPGPYDLTVAYKGLPINATPIHTDVLDVTSAKYSLMAVTTIKIQKVAVLVKAYNTKKDPKTIGGDKVNVYVMGPEGRVEHKVTDNNNGTYTVTYYADVPGTYEVHGLINGEPVIGSPKSYTL